MPSARTPREALRKGLIVSAVWLGVLGLLALGVSRTEAGGAHLAAIALRTDVGLLAASMTVMTGAIVLLAVRWRVLMPGGDQVPIGGLTTVVCAAMLLNVALPGPAGEVAACLVVSRRWGVPTEVALASDIHARFVGLAVVGAMAGVVWLAGDLPVPEGFDRMVGVAALTIAAGAVGLGVVSARPRWMRAIAAWVLRPVLGRPGRIGRLAGQLDEAVRRIADALGSVGGRGVAPYAWAVLFSAVGHLTVSGGIYVGAVAMGMDAHLQGILFTYAAATAGTVALYALPGTQLGWDALLCTFFVATAGLELPDALALTAVIRIQHLIVLALGAGALVWASRRVLDLDAEVPEAP